MNKSLPAVTLAIAARCLAQGPFEAHPWEKIQKLQSKASDASAAYDVARKDIEQNLFRRPYADTRNQINLVERRLQDKVAARREEYTALSGQMDQEIAATQRLGTGFDRAALMTDRNALQDQVASLTDENETIKKQIQLYRSSPTRESSVLEAEAVDRQNAIRDLKALLLTQKDNLSEILLKPDSVAAHRGELESFYRQLKESYDRELAAADQEGSTLRQYYSLLDSAARKNESASLIAANREPVNGQAPSREYSSKPPEMRLDVIAPAGMWQMVREHTKVAEAQLTVPAKGTLLLSIKPEAKSKINKGPLQQASGMIVWKAQGMDMIAVFRSPSPGIIACEIYKSPRNPEDAPDFEFQLRAPESAKKAK